MPMGTSSITSVEGSRKTSLSNGSKLLAIDCSSQVPVGQLITGGLRGESVGNKGAPGIKGAASYDKSNNASVVEDLLAVGGDGELARRF